MNAMLYLAFFGAEYVGSKMPDVISLISESSLSYRRHCVVVTSIEMSGILPFTVKKIAPTDSALTKSSSTFSFHLLSSQQSKTDTLAASLLPPLQKL